MREVVTPALRWARMSMSSVERAENHKRTTTCGDSGAVRAFVDFHLLNTETRQPVLIAVTLQAVGAMWQRHCGSGQRWQLSAGMSNVMHIIGTAAVYLLPHQRTKLLAGLAVVQACLPLEGSWWSLEDWYAEPSFALLLCC